LLLEAVTKARVVAKNLETLAYSFTEEDAQVVEELAQELESGFYEKLPNKGLILCPTSRQNRQYTCRKVQKAKIL